MGEKRFSGPSDSKLVGEALDERIPLVVLGGFLGAGKTTALNYLLRHSKGRRLAVLINDVGEINIDAALTRGLAQLEARSGNDTVELSNGCICCGIQGAFGEAVIELAKGGPDAIIVEATGIAEPEGVVASLTSRNEEGLSSIDFVRIVNLVTFVDSQWWLKKVEEAYTPVCRPMMLFSDPRRPLGELLSLQIEAASVIVLNKIDLVDEQSLRRSEAALSTLNPAAKILTAREGQIELEQLLGDGRFDSSTSCEALRSDLELLLKNDDVRLANRENLASQGHGEFGLMVFVYRSRNPIRHGKLVAFLRSTIPGLLRAKGFVWTDRDFDRVGYLSLAGDSLRFDYLGKWDSKGCSRRQEIVFIGIDLDRKEIEERLRACIDQVR